MKNLSMQCPFCSKKIKNNEYWPYCSFECTQWGGLVQAEMYIERRREKEK